MKIAIISDIHNNQTNLKKVLDYSRNNQVEEIICCGDLASQETLDFLCNNFAKPVHYVFGNMDGGQLRDLLGEKEYKNVKIFQDFGELKIEGLKIAFTHYPATAKDLARGGKYSFVFHGHTHKPWTEKVNSTTILNPGNVAGEIYPPTFAIWETKKDDFKLIRIHDLK